MKLVRSNKQKFKSNYRWQWKEWARPSDFVNYVKTLLMCHSCCCLRLGDASQLTLSCLITILALALEKLLDVYSVWGRNFLFNDSNRFCSAADSNITRSWLPHLFAREVGVSPKAFFTLFDAPFSTKSLATSAFGTFPQHKCKAVSPLRFGWSILPP